MVNDMTILGGIVFFFVILGVALPFVNSEFVNTSTSTYDPESLVGDSSDLTTVSAWQVMKSVVGMFFWTFGAVPLAFEVILFVPLRIIGLFIIARNIWIGGGA